MKSLKLASLFAGIGGIDLGFKMAGIEPVWANEIDEYASKTFRANHPHTKLVTDDIKNIKGSDIPKVDILAGGFPCQPFSIAGRRLGFTDTRGTMFFEIMRIVQEMDTIGNKPKVIFLENVRNLESHDNGNTFKTIIDVLEDFDYHVHHKVLNSCKYGNIPQNRERIFIIGFLDEEASKNFTWPKEIPLTNTIDKVIDWNLQTPTKYHYTNTKKCYNLLKQDVIKTNTIYQLRRVYVRENKSGVCPTLTANMGTGGNNVPIILTNSGIIRKLTPRETLLLQGFPKSYVIPNKLSDARVYKQAGNSVTVTVIERLALEIKRALQ